MRPDGNPISKEGLVLIKYQLEQEHEYWVNAGKVKSLPNSATVANDPPPPIKRAPVPSGETDVVDMLDIYTDGASSGNPGPAGIGVVLRYRGHVKEISESIGIATNNAAELKAVEAGLAAVKKTDLPVRIFTDSHYAYGVLVLNWKANKNKAQIASLKKTMSQFANLKIIQIKGHAGLEGNERADFLATAAIKKARN